MTRTERVQRVTMLLQHFTRNLAYYRSAWNEKKLSLSGSQFWRTVNGNCLDICVLEWCKLFADKNGEHYWGQIFHAPTSFLPELLHYIGLEKNDYDAQVSRIRRYRDKFVAHLDSDDVMHLPQLDVPKAAALFYHSQLVITDSLAANLSSGFAGLDEYYTACVNEAKAVYSRNARDGRIISKWRDQNE
jgi:hypothetical protein